MSLSFKLKIEGFSSVVIVTETYLISPKDLKKEFKYCCVFESLISKVIN